MLHKLVRYFLVFTFDLQLHRPALNSKMSPLSGALLTLLHVTVENYDDNQVDFELNTFYLEIKLYVDGAESSEIEAVELWWEYRKGKLV